MVGRLVAWFGRERWVIGRLGTTKEERNLFWGGWGGGLGKRWVKIWWLVGGRRSWSVVGS